MMQKISLAPLKYALLSLVITGILLGLPQSASAQREQATAPETLLIPFDPPLAKPFRYNVQVSRSRSRGDSDVTIEQELTFEKPENTFVLTLKTLSFVTKGQRLDLTDPASLAAIPVQVHPFLLPMKVELDDAGEMIRLRDWSKMQKDMEALPELIVERGDPTADREAAMRVATTIYQAYFDLSAEDAPSAMIKGWPEVLGYGGAEFDDGDVYVGEGQMYVSDNYGLVPTDVEFSLTKTDEGSLLFEQSSSPNPEQFRAALKARMADLFSTLEGEALEKAQKAFEGPIEIQIEDTVSIEFDPITGLPRHAVIGREMSGDAGESSGDVITISLIE